MFTAKPLDSVRGPNNWIGAIYYKMIMKQHNGKKFYTLLGFDNYTLASNKKWMEVLSFNPKGEPEFGGPIISFKNDTARRAAQSRFSIEYKKEASTFLNFDPQLDLIIFDHLISESNEPSKKDTYVPDGDYEGFKWENGQWVHIDKVFNFALKDGQFPTNAAIRDEQGKLNEQKLEEQSIRNLEKVKKKNQQ
jgi:hypothetical protein